MQTSFSAPSNEYIPRDDESEARRIQDLTGVGDTILDPDDVRMYSMEDLGISLRNDFNG